MSPENIINLEQHPIQASDYSKSCKDQLDSTGAMVMEDFLNSDTVEFLQNEAREVRPLA